HRQADTDTAAHRVADDVDPVQPQRIGEGQGRALGVDHGVTAEVVADPEPRELQDEATEMLGEHPEIAAEIAPSGDTRPGAVQQQQRWPVTGLVVAQHPGRCAYLAQRLLVIERSHPDKPFLCRSDYTR